MFFRCFSFRLLVKLPAQSFCVATEVALVSLTSSSVIRQYGFAVRCIFVSFVAILAVRSETAAQVTITTVAGNGNALASGDGGPATTAGMSADGIAVDAAGNLYIADYVNNRIRKVDGTTGLISTIAGNGTQGFSGDGGPAISAQVFQPGALALDQAGNLYIADVGNNRVRMITAAGTIKTVAGTGGQGFSGDGGPATSAQFSEIRGLAVDKSGNLYIVDAGNNRRIRKVTAAGTITTVAGNGAGFSGDGGPAISAGFFLPWDVAVDGAGNLFIGDHVSLREVTAAGTINSVKSVGGGTTPAANVAVDSAGAIFMTMSRLVQPDNNTVLKLTPGAFITTVAGVGRSGFSGDGGLATAANLAGPGALALDTVGNLYIADVGNNRVRKVSGVANPVSNAVYTISGRVIDSNGNPLAAVNVALTGARSQSTSTTEDGRYEFPNLPAGTYAVTPSRSGYIFSPGNASFTNINSNQTANFIAQAVLTTYTISGRVTDSNGNGLSGVNLALAGSISNSTVTSQEGTYQFANLGAGSYSVTPSFAGYTFTPTTASFTNINSNQTANFSGQAVGTSPVSTFYYPHVINGILGNVVWKTTILLTNLNPTTAVGTIAFTKENSNPSSAGSAFELGFMDQDGQITSGSIINFVIPVGQTRKYVSTGVGAFGAGFATVTTTAGTIFGTAIFSEFDLAGRLTAEAGVPAVSASSRQAIFVDTLRGYNTGLAYVNVGTTSAAITFSLLNSAGVTLATSTQILGPNNHRATFTFELFPSVAALAGTLQVSSSVPLGIMALRFDPTLSVFTTLPPATFSLTGP
jgi:sugar lactone lactonase YvrE